MPPVLPGTGASGRNSRRGEEFLVILRPRLKSETWGTRARWARDKVRVKGFTLKTFLLVLVKASERGVKEKR